MMLRIASRRSEGLRLLFFAALLLLWSPVRPAAGQEGARYVETPIRDVIADIEGASPYRFLYRDALITGKAVSLDVGGAGGVDALITALDGALHPYGLRLQVDAARRQVLVTEAPEASAEPARILTGQVMDDERGTRLPFATITWEEGGQLRGLAANEAGAFRLPLDPYLAGLDYLVLTASYVGYRPRQLRVDLDDPPGELPIRLRPHTLFGQEVVVSGTLLDAALDTTWRHLLRPGLFSPLGEANVMRALQSLPSVGLSTALTQGLNVRGSRADGFQVLLDGVPIYNQNHFFGLFDAFNEDALQTVGFFYGVTPARFQAPPGATLSLVTRTGSQTAAQQQIGLSNTSVKGTFEGPLWGGRGSWLLSGRHSYLNAIDWFNNAELIAQGLDVGRETSAPQTPSPGQGQRNLFPGVSSASFYDLHGKLYREADDGSRLMLNAYLGGDDTRHEEARRFLPGATPGRNGMQLDLQRVDTRNAWSNEAASLHDQRPLGARAFSHALLAFTRYHSRFAKDDFVYTLPAPRDSLRPGGPGPNRLIDRFDNDNELVELKAAYQADLAPSSGGTLSAGLSLHRFSITYEEHSALRTGFAETRRSTQVDLFAEYDAAPIDALDLHAGLRSHYFSQGGFFRLSPRLRARLWPQRTLSLSLGYSHNHQFLHRLYLEHANSSDVWIMSTADEPPGTVDNGTAGLYLKLPPSVFFQAEAYTKFYRNLRQHETTAFQRPVREGSLLLEPWLHDNEARAHGLELMLRHRLGPLLWTHGYTHSRVEIHNDRLDDGAYFPADWDRRHQFTTHVEGTLSAAFSWHLTWLVASGAPNTLAFTDPDEPARLPAYHRLDASLLFRRRFGGMMLEATASAFNLYDRENTWYRTPLSLVDPPSPGRQLGFVNVDVYDLGFQPSFSIAVTF